MVSRCPPQARLFRKPGLFFRQGADRVSAPTRHVCGDRPGLVRQLENGRRDHFTNAGLAVGSAHSVPLHVGRGTE